MTGQKLNTANESNNRRQSTGTMKTKKAVVSTAKNAKSERGIATADVYLLGRQLVTVS